MNYQSHYAALSFFALAALTLLGCGGPTGPETYKLTGSVTYQGQPVPAGEIQFTPNSREGNSGPGTIAAIKDGKYETPDGRGVVGGSYGVRIVGYDGRANSESDYGISLFPPHSEKADLPKEDATVDFEIPAK